MNSLGKGQVFNMAKQNRFTLNGVTYIAKPFDFDMVCELEDMGVTFERIDKMPMSLIRAYFAICAETNKAQAAALIQKHMINGGKLDDITDAMSKEMDASDFFRSLQPEKEKTSTTGKTKEKETNEESVDTLPFDIG